MSSKKLLVVSFIILLFVLHFPKTTFGCTPLIGPGGGGVSENEMKIVTDSTHAFKPTFIPLVVEKGNLHGLGDCVTFLQEVQYTWGIYFISLSFAALAGYIANRIARYFTTKKLLKHNIKT